MYTTDDCATKATIGFDLIRKNDDGTTHRLATFDSLKVALLTAKHYPGSTVVKG